MTAPLPSLTFRAIFQPQAGTTNLIIPESYRNESSIIPDRHYQLPAGVNAVEFSWDGAEAVTLVASARRSPAGSAYFVIGVIPAGVAGAVRTFFWRYSSPLPGLVRADLSSSPTQTTLDKQFSLGMSGVRLGTLL